MPPSPTNGTEENGETVPRFEFTYVETLMYAFHRLGSQCPDFLNANADRLKDFLLRFVLSYVKLCKYFQRFNCILFSRLRYLDSGVLHFMKNAQQLEGNESCTALALASNIRTLIREFHRIPPAYKAIVTSSFKPAVTSQTVEAEGGKKRKKPVEFPSPPPKKQAKGEVDCVSLDDERIIDECCRKAFTLMTDVKIGIRDLLVRAGAWPVPVAYSDSFRDTIEALKSNSELYFPRVTRDAEKSEEIEKLCDDLWEVRIRVCHFKHVLKEKNERVRTYQILNRLKTHLNEELSVNSVNLN